MMKIEDTMKIETHELNKLLTFTVLHLKDKNRGLHKMLLKKEEEWRRNYLIYEDMDLLTMQQKTKNNVYHRMAEFQADAQLVVHNVVLYYGELSPAANMARQMLKDCCYELSEIQECRDCYRLSNEKQDKSWFCQPCDPPHALVFAKQKRFPYWPAKVISRKNDLYNVRYFGGYHQRAMVKKDYIQPITTSPQHLQLKRTVSLNKALDELKHHQQLLQDFAIKVKKPHSCHKSSSSYPRSRSSKGFTSAQVELSENEAKNASLDECSTASSPKIPRFKQNSMTFEEIIRGLRSSDPDLQFKAAENARKVLSCERIPPCDHMFEANVIPAMVRFLAKEDNPSLQFEAAWALTVIASGNSRQTAAVVNAGAVPYFICMLSSPYPSVAEQAVCALGNIAGDGAFMSNCLIKRGILEPLLKLVQLDAASTFIRNVTWALSNLCCNANQVIPFEIMKTCVPVFAQLIQHPDTEVVSYSCWALSCLTYGTNEKIQEVLDTGVVPRLVELLQVHQFSVLYPVVCIIGNIVSGDDDQTQAVIDAGALTSISRLLRHENLKVVEKSALAVSNITAGNEQQIQHVIDLGLVDPILEILDRGDFTSLEAIWIVKNFTSGGNVNQIFYLVQAGVIPPLCKLLTIKDAEVLLVLLDAFTNILKAATVADNFNACERIIECGGLDKIKRLQSHENNDVYRAAVNIIHRFFSTEKEEKEEMQTVTALAIVQEEPGTSSSGGSRTSGEGSY